MKGFGLLSLALSMAMSVALSLAAGSASAKGLSASQAATLMGYLERCVTASLRKSPAPFDDWTVQEVRVPGVYLSYAQRTAPDGAFFAVMGARKDHPGQPFVCRVIRSGGNGNFLSVDQEDRDIVRHVQNLPETTLSGVEFRRNAGFKTAYNSERLSGCINGQVLIISPDVTNKGAASFGVSIPLLEERAC